MSYSLVMIRTWSDPDRNDDWTVAGPDRRSLARLYRDKAAIEEVWVWSVNGFNAPQTSGMRGRARSLDEAKGAMRPIIERLLDADTPRMSQPPHWTKGTLFG